MKQKIKNLVSEIIRNSYSPENEIPIQNVSIYISIIIACLSIRNNSYGRGKIKISYHTYRSEFRYEMQLIKQRFPKLMEVFNNTEYKLKEESLILAFERLDSIFNEIDDDIDDLISWSYQFFKRGLEKAAFRKIGKDKAKILSADLLFTTQFFTDKYMVKYLVDESLNCVDTKDIEKVVVIDCASGGGNFLNYSFERLFNLYRKTKPNWSNQEIVDYILNNAIVGYDLDYNLSEVASLSLFAKACSYSVPNRSTKIRIYGGVSHDKLGFLNPNVISNTINKSTFKSQLEKISKEKRIKVFVTNPPFMGKRDMDTSLKSYLLSNYSQSNGDLCVSFIQRIIQVMNDKDVLGVVSQNNWLYLSSLKEFRKFFLEQQTLIECVDLGSRAFQYINGEKASVALCIIGNSTKKTSRFYNLKFKCLHEKRRAVIEKNIPKELTFELNQSQFLKYSNLEFNYQLEHRFNNIRKLSLYSQFAKPMQGTSTGNNAELVKYAWQVNGNPDWKLVSKGGGFSKWAGLNYYKVHWGDNAEIIRANKGSALRNIDRIPSTQLVYSDTGTLGLNVRMLKDNQVFIASGPGIQVLKGDKYAHLAFLNSRVATFLLKLINPKFTISAGYISKIPVAQNILDSKSIADKGKECLELKESYLQRKLPNVEFRHSDYAAIQDVNAFIEKSITEDMENDYQRLLLESQIDIEIRKQYKFTPNELAEIRSVVGAYPFSNKKKTMNLNPDRLDFILSSSIDLNCLSTSRTINGYSVGSESILEDLSCKVDVNPKTILDLIRNRVSLLHITKGKYFTDLLHKIILHELGIKQISNYKCDTLSAKVLVNKIVSRYAFLKHHPKLSELIISILNSHHKISFFNKPLVSLSNDTLTVRQVQNG